MLGKMLQRIKSISSNVVQAQNTETPWLILNIWLFTAYYCHASFYDSV